MQAGGRTIDEQEPPVIPPFELHSSRFLRRHGISGRRVSVGLGENALYIAGRGGQVLTLPLDSVRSILVGRDRNRALVFHRLELRSTGTGRIVLKAKSRTDDLASYAALVHAAAAFLESRGRLDTVRIGLPRLYAFGIPLLVAMVLAGAGFVATDPASLRATPPGDFALGGLLILAIVAVATGAGFLQGFHRRVRSLGDLDRFIARA